MRITLFAALFPALTAALYASAGAAAQHGGHDADAKSAGSACPMMHRQEMAPGPCMMDCRGAATPLQPGESVFGAIQEIVIMLENDPDTDWSTVDIDRLRAHLIDMNQIALHAAVESEEISDGARFTVAGAGETSAAIKRMTLAHARAMNGEGGWRFETHETAGGVILTVRAEKDAEKIRALGFSGVMARGGHHQLHHLMIARGGKH